MKKIIITSLIALLAFGNISMKKADEIKWLGFNEGYALAKKKNKIMLVDVYTDWCGWCKRMDRDAFAKNDISSIVSKDYVANCTSQSLSIIFFSVISVSNPGNFWVEFYSNIIFANYG